MKKKSNIVIGILAALCVISIVALVIHFSNHDSQNVNVNNQNVNVNNRLKNLEQKLTDLTKLQDIAHIHEDQLQQLIKDYRNLNQNVFAQQQQLQDIANNTVPADGYLSEVDSINSSFAFVNKDLSTLNQKVFAQQQQLNIVLEDISTLQKQKKEKYTYLRRWQSRWDS
jgi:chromosome segregation ATPase